MKSLIEIRKIWKRAGIIFAIVCVTFLGSSITSSAYETNSGDPNDASATMIFSGHCGDHAEYTLYSNGDLYITGYGDMFDFTSVSDCDELLYSPTPWNKYLKKLHYDDYDALPQWIHVYIDADITSIGDYEFFAISNYLGSVTFESESKCKSIGKFAFADNWGLKSFVIPAGVKNIGDYAFQGNSLENVIIPNTVTHIGKNAFAWSGLKSVTLPASLTYLGKSAFNNCDSLTSADLSKSKIKSMKYTFSDCTALKTVSLPSTLTTIDTGAFVGCSNLPSITIPVNVTKIQKSAFGYTKKLKTITIKSKKLTSIGANAIQNSYRKLVIKVPASKYSAYKKLFTANTGYKSTMSIKKY